jgi:ribosome-associated protein
MQIAEHLPERNFEKELVFTATRSSGPGGQHVNKVSTRIELRFDVQASRLLNENEKHIIMNKLGNRISKDGILIIVSQAGRSQFENKTKAEDRFHKLIAKALLPEKKRTKTKPTFSSTIKRLESKQIRSKKKVLRKSSFSENMD